MDVLTTQTLSGVQTSIEVAGTVAFALSGVMAAARKKLDAVGVCAVASVAAFGGGTLRDVLTLFDEGGMIVLSADPALSQLLRDFAWKPLFLERRSQVIDLMRFFVFGHALQEKALAPHRGITAKCLMLPVTPDQLGWSMSQWLPWLDAQVCDYFSRPESLSSTRLLAPLPVRLCTPEELGVPFAPVEDLLFGFAMVVLTLVLWVWWGRRGVQRTPPLAPP